MLSVNSREIALDEQREGLQSKKECRYRAELDLETLVWTRGRAFPLSSLDSRLATLT